MSTSSTTGTVLICFGLEAPLSIFFSFSISNVSMTGFAKSRVAINSISFFVIFPVKRYWRAVETVPLKGFLNISVMASFVVAAILSVTPCL